VLGHRPPVPAGLQSALFLADGCRKVVAVEKSPAMAECRCFRGLFPTMECALPAGALRGGVLHGNDAHNIELLLLSEVTASLATMEISPHHQQTPAVWSGLRASVAECA